MENPYPTWSYVLRPKPEARYPKPEPESLTANPEAQFQIPMANEALSNPTGPGSYSLPRQGCLAKDSEGFVWSGVGVVKA